MSPKVKFMKKEESPKKEETIEDEKSIDLSGNKDDLIKKRNERIYNVSLTESNVSQKNQFSNSVYNVKRTPKKI